MNKLQRITIGLTVFVALVAAAVAQEEARRKAALNPPLVAGNMVGFAVVIVAWDEKDREIAAKLGQLLKPVVEAIARGATLTKADAARTGRPVEELQRLQDWFQTVVGNQRLTGKAVGKRPTPDIVLFKLLREGAEVDRTVANILPLPCPDCPKLDPIPIEDSVLTGSGFRSGYAAGSDRVRADSSKFGGQPMAPHQPVVVFILGDIAHQSEQEKQALLQLITEGVEETRRSESRLVIKTKSIRSQAFQNPSGDTARVIVLHNLRDRKDELAKAFSEAAKRLPENFWVNPDSATLEEFGLMLSNSRISSNSKQTTILRKAFTKYGNVLVFNTKQKPVGEEGGCPKPIEPHCFDFVRPPFPPICMCLLDLGFPESYKSQRKRQIILSLGETSGTDSNLRNVLDDILDDASLIGQELAKRSERVILLRYLPIEGMTLATEEDIKKAFELYYPKIFDGSPALNREIFMYCYRKGKDGKCREWYICEIENNVAKRCIFVIDGQIYNAIYVFG